MLALPDCDLSLGRHPVPSAVRLRREQPLFAMHPLILVMTISALALHALPGCSGSSNDETQGCGSDSDCKGNRICVSGECVSPGEGDVAGADVAGADVAVTAGTADAVRSARPASANSPPARAWNAATTAAAVTAGTASRIWCARGGPASTRRGTCLCNWSTPAQRHLRVSTCSCSMGPWAVRGSTRCSLGTSGS